MSSFSYGEHTKKHIGVWIRTYGNPDLVSLIKKTKLKRVFDFVDRIIVNKYDKSTDEVWLQIWCYITNYIFYLKLFKYIETFSIFQIFIYKILNERTKI